MKQTFRWRSFVPCKAAISFILLLQFEKLNAQPFDFLNINNINARVNAGGSLFQDLTWGQAAFEVPKGSGKHTILNAELWIGGLQNGTTLHQAGQLYGGFIGDTTFWPGPIMDTSSYSVSQDLLWNRVWKVEKSDIESHMINWTESGYVIPQSLIDWPGNGDVSKGQAKLLAPFFDRVGDDVYDPADGDYPLIRGDQAIYFIYNDDRKVHLNGGEKLKIEIHGMAYAYNCLQDSALYNTIFVHYEIVNRSNNVYDSTFLGINYDPDIGNIDDDYIECDVARGSFFGFNADSIDGFGNLGDYGASPPAQALTFLKGPKMADDTLDNPNGECDESINGYGFEDGIIDNECYGMTHFKSYCVPGCSIVNQNDPYTATDFYNYLKGNWKDGTKVKYGGFGSTAICSSCEDTRFMYPSDSDTCHWGSKGIVPGDTIAWTEASAGISPNDKRGVGSMGPFTFVPGDTVEIDIAFVFGRDYADTTGDLYASVIVMRERIDSAKSYFESNFTPCGDVFDQVTELKQVLPKVYVFPNPVSEVMRIQMNQVSKIKGYEVYNLIGERVLAKSVPYGVMDSGGIVISVKHLKRGVYILRVISEQDIFFGKFIKA